MPKIIADLEPALRKEARRMMLEEGYEALTMRAVAANCKVAVGTVYNYFSSKEMLAASVMLEDWQAALARMDEAAKSAEDALTGLKGIYLEIVYFWRIYERAWSAYANAGRAVPMRGEYHERLVAQLSGIMAPMLERFGAAYTPVLPAFLAECLLGAAAHGEARFEALTPVFRRIL